MINNCSNVVIDSIEFSSNVTGVFAITTTFIDILNCTFIGHTGRSVILTDISNGTVSDCFFRQNTLPRILDIISGKCITCKNIRACGNVLTPAPAVGISVQNTADVSFENCLVNINTGPTSGASLLVWQLLNVLRVNLLNCTANNNAASGIVLFQGFSLGQNSKDINFVNCSAIGNQLTSGSTFAGFLIDSSSNVMCTGCHINHNFTGGSSGTIQGFNTSSSSAVLFSECFVLSNTTTGTIGNITGFLDDSSSGEVVYEQCKVIDNGSIVNMTGFSISSDRSCLLNCIAKNNTGPSTVTGFSFGAASSNLTVRSNIATSNNGGSTNTGFLNSGTNNVILENQAQGHGTAGATNYNIAGSTNIVASFNPSTGAYTAPGGANPVPGNFVNISVTLP